jgi:hypothetical protein
MMIVLIKLIAASLLIRLIKPSALIGLIAASLLITLIDNYFKKICENPLYLCYLRAIKLGDLV